MDKWDNEEFTNSKNSLGSKRVLVLLIGIMIIMWVVLFALTYYTSSIHDCDYIQEFVNSDEFFALPDSETRQNYIDAQYECNKNSIVVK